MATVRVRLIAGPKAGRVIDLAPPEAEQLVASGEAVRELTPAPAFEESDPMPEAETPKPRRRAR